LVIADPLHDRLVFVRLADGQEVHEHPTTLPGDGCIERPSATRDTEAAIVRCGPHEFVAISGGGPNVRSVSVEPVIESNELSCAGSVVPFLTSTSELVAWHMEEQRLLNLGPIRDRPGGALRFCEVWPGSYVVGTSFGELRSFSRAAGSIASRKIGKRIAHLAVSGTVLLCATDSGEVIGLDRDRTSSPPSASSPRG
jgi:hypothetical protein